MLEREVVNQLLRTATIELASFLSRHLPSLADDWWTATVIDRLSFQQQRIVSERGFATLEQLDFAALIRVFDQNWYELSQHFGLPKEGRHWVKELQSVRNKWAHLSAQAISPGEIFRDADTFNRLLEMIEASPAAIEQAEQVKASAVARMAKTDNRSDEGMPKLSATDRPLEETAEGGDRRSDEERPKKTSLFQVGELVSLRSDTNTVVPIIDVIPGGAECSYSVFQDNKRVSYFESQLLKVDERAEEEITQVSASQLHAHLTSRQLLSPSIANLYSLRSGRVQFVPYQYRPVLKLIRADRPRLLIADEVGVGKTIEAGLIIKELRARMDIESILIICPKALVAERKWFVEMKRFDEHFTALDGQLLRHCLHETDLEAEWPDQYSKAIIPFSLFNSDLLFGQSGKRRRSNEGLLALDPPPKFDLVIVDEAHHIRNSETFLHQGVRYFCDNSQAAIFLTATPVQLGSEDLFTLLNVLRPDLVIDETSFEQMAAPNRSINEAIRHSRRADADWQQLARECLDEVVHTQWGRLFLCEDPGFQSVYDKLGEAEIEDAERVQLIRTLEELYTFSPMINRTRRRDIGEFTTRKPETLRVDFTEEQKQLHDDLLDIIARILTYTHGHQNVKFMMTTIRRQAASCLYGLAPLLSNILAGKLDTLEMMEAGDVDLEPDVSFIDEIRMDIESLLSRARALDSFDPKVQAFVGVLRDKSRMDNNKALVFSTFRHTLAYLEAHVDETGLRSGVIHGGIADEERADLRRRFALPKESSDAIDLLLSSEVGCEGLDFQFCDLLINYDLPWNPMRIEQRIGRLDRYGQKSETVAIVNLVTPGTVDADIYDRCLWRIGVFQHAVGGSEEILGEITRQIHDIAESFELGPEECAQRLQQLADNSIRVVQEEQSLEEKQAELFGLNVPKQSWRDEIRAAETFWLSPAGLQRCVSSYLESRLEAEGEFFLGDKPLKTLRLNQEARSMLLFDLRNRPRSTDPVFRRWEKWLKGTEPMLPVTFDQDTASAHPTVVHLNVLHPLVRQAAQFHARDEALFAQVTAHSPAVEPGDYPFALYHWRKLGIRPDDTIVAVTADAVLDTHIMDLLTAVTDTIDPGQLESYDWDALFDKHHAQWSQARAEHLRDNETLTEHRLQSLNASHHARCQLLGDQLDQATDEKIRRMKQSELSRAEKDYERRRRELQQAARSADIHAEQFLIGTISIRGAQA
jgi:superfamily II DNA or RNA helicase